MLRPPFSWHRASCRAVLLARRSPGVCQEGRQEVIRSNQLVCRPDSTVGREATASGRKVYRFTVDVSDVVPVTVGPVRSWFVR